MTHKGRKIVLGFQSIYYLLTGLWPLFHIRSFMEVSGYKTDLWLVKTVGILITCVALAFVTGLFSRERSTALVTLSISCAVGLLGIDVYYSLGGVISKIYLVDAVSQGLVIMGWVVVLARPGS